MGEIVRVDFADPRQLERWDAYLARRDDGHCTDGGRWRLFYRELYGLRDLSFAYLVNGVVGGVVSLYHFRSPFLGNFLVTTPFFGYGGLYADEMSIRDALLERVGDEAVELGVDYVELRLRHDLPPPFVATHDFLESELELGNDAERVWSEKLSSNVRQNIRRSRKSDLDFRLTTDPRACHALLNRTLRAHGTPFHGRRMFELLRRHFPRETAFSEVWQGSTLTAAGVVMTFGDSVITPYIGSLHRYRPLRANYAQYWGIVEHCVAAGVPRFELGRSPKGSTHIRFKRKWGARDVPVTYNYLVLDPKKGYRSVTDLSRGYTLAVEVWKRLPLALTSGLGPRLARYVP